MKIKQYLFEKFDSFMIKNKRKLTMVDTYGNVIIHKYCIFRKESLDPVERSKAKFWPNVYIHNFLWEESPDGPSSHSHSGTTLSFIVKGEYYEKYKQNIIHRKRWSINVVKFPEVHKLEWVKKDTWTIFIRWFIHDPQIRIVPDDNRYAEFKYDAYSNQHLTDKPKGLKFPAWHYAGQDTDIFIARRKLAMKRIMETSLKKQNTQDVNDE